MKDGRVAMARRRWLMHCSVALMALAATGRAAGQNAGLPAASAPVGRADAPAILIVGDSLSAEYGIRRGSGWAALLQERLERERIRARVVNASISGDTTAGGASRLAALLREHRPTHVLIELGGNDALRGLPLESTRANLVKMVQQSKAAGAKVLIAGMQMPPNYGKRYADDFAALFAAVAKAEGAALVPFILAGIADGPEPVALFQPDRIHPNEQAQPRIVDNVWPVLAAWIR
jgi:acyl-CoA thioesterase-1